MPGSVIVAPNLNFTPGPKTIMLDDVRMELLSAGADPEAFRADDAMTGTLNLRSQGGAQRYDRFSVQVLRYLASWEITGTVLGSGVSAPFSLALDERENSLIIGVDARLWTINTNSSYVRVINGFEKGELMIRFLREVFSTNEPSWYITPNSVLYARDSG